MGGNPLLDLPDSGNPLLALVPEKKKPAQTEGVLGKIGDFLVDNLGGVSATMRDNAQTGVFADDAANDGGFLDRAGSLIERGAASVDQGIYNFLGGLGSQKARDAAAGLKEGTTGRDILGTTGWKDVNSSGSLGSFVLDAGIESLPAMGALAVPYAGPALIAGSQTGNIASERAANNNTGDITGDDLLSAAPAALLSTALDRFGLKGIKNPAGNKIAARIAGAGLREAGTEAAQSGIEYTGGTLGTVAGFDPSEAGSQMLAGGLAGGGMGAAARVGVEPIDAYRARRGGQQPQAGQDDTDWEGSLDDLLAPEQAPSNPLLALPAPVAYADSLGDTAIGSDALNRLDQTSAARRTEAARPDRPAPVENGSTIVRGIFGDKARITSGYRGPDHPLSKKNPNSWHAKSAAAVDMAPIPGVTFAQAKKQIEAQGYTLIEAINEVGKGKTKHATGDHWHFVIGKGGAPVGATPDNPYALMPDVEIPGADGSLLNRGEQDRIAKIDTPEMSGQDWRIPETQAKPEQQEGNTGGGVPALPRENLPDVPPARQGQISQVIAPRVGPVDTMFELRDIAELIDSATPGYDPSLQPRDRAGRAASGAQVASIAGALDPRQLGDSRLASIGAPIIGPDGQVESGNGRIAALRQVYAQFPEQAQAYRQMISDRGLDATGLQFPVLVRRRTTEMTPQQRQDWTRAANERDTMAMSSTEQATSDARSLPDTTLSLYRGGTVTAAGNRDFVRAFIDRAVAPAERNAMIAPDGSLSTDGVRRIRFALMARAYGDSELIGRISEDTDTNIAAIGKALLEAAPAMAKLKAGIDAGDIPPQYDISKNIAEAARMVARSRDTGQSLQGMLAQTDAFADKIAPETEAVLNLFYRDAELKRPRSAVKIADDLIDYARLAETQAETAKQGNDMFGNAPTLDSPAMLLQRVRSGEDGEQIDLLAPQPEKEYVAPDEQGNRPSGQTATDAGSNDRDSRAGSAVSTLARGQLRALGIAAELRTREAAALVGRTASTPRELAEIAQVYRDPRYETFRIFLTKGDTIVHATGVSMRLVTRAPLMPKDMDDATFIASMKQTMADTGADGYYLLHNHPSGDPKPSPADMNVTRGLARSIPGFRSHIVINSNKYAEITPNQSGVNVAKVSELSTGDDKLIAASTPHDVLGRTIEKGGDLVALGKELQKPGWITVIGTDARAKVRVVVDYPATATKKDVRSLMAMARRVQRQSGSASLFLVGPRSALDTPVVKRALSGDIVAAAIDESGEQIDSYKLSKKNKMPLAPARYVAEDAAPFDRGTDPGPKIASGLVDSEGISRDVQKIRDVVGNPVETLKGITSSGLADNARAIFYSMDSRLRAYAERFNSPSITKLADMFYARPGTGDGAVTETYHEAVEREGLGRAAQSLRILEPFIGDKAAMERITKMLRLPAERQRGRRAEAEAAAKIAKLLKDTLEYRRAAGEDIGEVTTGYFPRWLDVEKVVQNRNLFLSRATQLFEDNDAPNPRASAEAWLSRTFDQYAGIDGGLDLVDLFHDTREAGPGRRTTKPRKFGEDADRLLGEFYQNDAGEVLTAYFMGGAKRAEETRRFGNVRGANDGAQLLAADTQLKELFDQIQDEIRNSGEDGGEAVDAIAGIVARNLGRIATPSVRVRGAMSFLHTASQLGTLDRATITSLSEAMMGFVRGGARYGLPMLIRSVRNFAAEIRKAPLDEAGRMAEFLGIAQSALVSEALAARNGYERAQTSRRAQKVQQGFFRATGLEQWTTGTRRAATAMGQEFIYQMARDVVAGKPKSAKYLNELGVTDVRGFSRWLMDGGNPSPEELVTNEASANARAYRGALLRFVNQTIMKPTRAEKPKWASSPYGSLAFALMSYSYGFKKNVLDRVGRMGMRAIREGDPTLLYPAFGMAGLLAMHTVINQPIREALLGGGREEDEEGIQFLDMVEALDKAGLFGAASPLLNAMFGLKYRRGTMESLVGPTIGRPFELIDKTAGVAMSTNSEKTNNAERAAAAAIYDVVLEPAAEAYGVTRFKGYAAAGVVWGSGNREGGVLPSDREAFISALAGPKEE